jgi:lysophospholipase L1-like esterase
MLRLFAAFVALALALPAAGQVVRENIEWLDVWIPNTNDTGLPRVLLIGDSITRGYGKDVEAGLAGKAYVARMATSKSLGDPALVEQIALVLREKAFDVVHFNNGMHGDGYSEEAYAAALPAVLAAIRRGAPGARIVLATTTDVRERDHLDRAAPKTERMLQRNRLLTGFAQRENLPVDDLFAVVRNHPEYHAADGVHFTAAGYALLAAQVVQEIGSQLHGRKLP